MKILIVRTIAIEEDCSQKTYNNQGIGLATELSKRGHQCGLVYYAKPGNRKIETVVSDGQELVIYHLEGKNIIWNAIYNKEIYDIAAEYDVIQVSECDQIASWLMFARFPDKTLIYHGPYKSRFTVKYNLRSQIFDRIFSWQKNFQSVRVITKSRLSAEYLNKKGFKNTTTLGVGLNPGALEKHGQTNEKLIQKLESEKGVQKYILYVGAISKRKNLTFVIDILEKLVANHKNYKLLIVGGKAYKEDDYFEKCFREIQTKGLNDNVAYLGAVNQETIAEIYKLSDVFVLPTQYDIFGMVYLEAMYFGVPIVTSLCGGSSLLIENGITGYICDLEDAETWEKQIEKILESQETIKMMRENGKKLICEKYTWFALAPMFENEYKKLMRGKNEQKEYYIN